MSNWIEIINNLYLGNLSSIDDKPFLESISLAINISNQVFPINLQNKFLNLTIYDICINDEPNVNISQYFNATFQLINNTLKQNKKILVYCKAGKSRSVTIILNYFMTKDNLSYDLAFIKILYRKSQIGPNDGFIKQLKEHRKNLLKEKYKIQNFIDMQTLKELKFNISQKLIGKKTEIEWENLRKEREIERYLDSLQTI